MFFSLSQFLAAFGEHTRFDLSIVSSCSKKVPLLSRTDLTAARLAELATEWEKESKTSEHFFFRPAAGNTRFVFVDLDAHRGGIAALEAILAQRPIALVDSGGEMGGLHVYIRLAGIPLPHEWAVFASHVTAKLGGDPNSKKLGQYSRLPGFRNPKPGGRLCRVELLAPSLVRTVATMAPPVFAGMRAPEVRSRSRSPRGASAATRSGAPRPGHGTDRSSQDVVWCFSWIRASNLAALGLSGVKDTKAVSALATALAASGAPKCNGRFESYAIPTARYALTAYRG